MSTELFQRADVDWIPLVIFVLWALSGLFGNKKRKQRREEEAGEIPPPRQRTEQVERGGANTELQEVLREIERDLGLEPAKRAPRVPEPLPEEPRGPWHAAPSPTKAGEQRSRALHRRGPCPSARGTSTLKSACTFTTNRRHTCSGASHAQG